jgi:hypothetical protein
MKFLKSILKFLGQRKKAIAGFAVPVGVGLVAKYGITLTDAQVVGITALVTGGTVHQLVNSPTDPAPANVPPSQAP